MRFIDTASDQISESNGMFEMLSPASQTALLNIAFSGDFLRIPDLKAFSDRIKHYFSLNMTFTRMSNNWEGLDQELQKHCHILKMQRVSPYELAQYYVEYMKRHVLEPDPIVLEKIRTQEYSRDISSGYGGIKAGDMWVSPADLEKKQMMELQMKLNTQGGHPGMQQGYGQPPHLGGYAQGPNPNMGMGMPGNQAFMNNQQGAPANTHMYGAPTPAQPNTYQQPGYQQWNPAPVQQPQQNINDFAAQQGFGNFHQQPQQPQQANNFFNQPVQAPTQPQTPVYSQNFQAPHGVGQSRPPQQQFKVNESNPFAAGLGHDDIFGNENQGPVPAFGGPAKPPGFQSTGDPQMDQFLLQLDDLKKL